MPADRQDLAARVAAATPADTSRGLNYNSAFGLLREVGGAEAARRCDPLGKGSRVDFFSYPIGEYLEMAWCAAEFLEPRVGSIEEAFFALGARTVTDHLTSVLGRTLYAIAGRDVTRMLSNVPSSYRATVSYGERTVEWVGERRARLRFRRDFLVPDFHRGVIAAGVAGVGGTNVQVSGRQTGFLDTEYEVAWD